MNMNERFPGHLLPAAADMGGGVLIIVAGRVHRRRHTSWVLLVTGRAGSRGGGEAKAAQESERATLASVRRTVDSRRQTRLFSCDP
jgi:hypothetical protein